LVVAAIALVGGGCGAIFHGSTDTVAVTSNVDRATVHVDGAAVSQTPGHVEVSSSHPHTVSVRAPGYREASATINTEVGAGWVVLDCLWLVVGVVPGVIALVVDGASGDWKEADTERVHLQLERDTGAWGAAGAAPDPSQPWAAAREGAMGQGAAVQAMPPAAPAR
jgi:hypothetical protein